MIVTIGGNIGCGKSTVIQQLKNNYPSFLVYQEPIENWGSWLDLFYTDPNKHAFGFQMKVFLEFMYPIKDNDKIVITERSPYDSLYIFSKTLKDNGTMSYMEYNLFYEYLQKFGWKPDVYIYMRIDPELCFKRIKERSRGCECGITLKYLQQLHNAHEAYIKLLKDLSTEVHEIDAVNDKEQVYTDIENMLYTL